MNKFYLFLAIISITLLSNCGDDILGAEETESVTSQVPTTTKSSNVLGIVVSEDNLPLPNVNVTYNSINYLTDDNGVFKIKNVKASTDGGILFFEKENYFKNYKFFYPNLEASTFVKVQMINLKTAEKISGMEGGELQLDNNVKISFPTNAFISENGISYEGEVDVYTHWFNPAGKDLAISMPGDLRGLTNDGQLVQLATYGMMAVELKSSNGQELQLIDNKKATLTFPIPQSLINLSPESIPSWSLNEETIYWEEEEMAVKNNSSYVFEVSHFSFWNCDVPHPLVNISGKLIDKEENPIPYSEICISAFNNTLTGYGWSDSNGFFQGKVPQGENLLFSVKNECGNIVFEREISATDTDISLGSIIIEDAKKINSTLMCNGMPVTSGYAVAYSEEEIVAIGEVDEEGKFVLFLNSCIPGNIFIKGVDILNKNESELVELPIDLNDNIELDPIQTCEELDEFIILKKNNLDEVLYLNPFANLTTQEINGINIKTYTIGVKFENDSLNIITIDPIQDQTIEAAEAAYTQFDPANLITDLSSCISGNKCIDITFLSIGETEDDFLEGTFMGNIQNSSGIETTLMGSFKIRIDNVTEISLVSGRVWLDQNGDGIRQADEQGIEDIRISRTPNWLTTTTDSEGYYSIPVQTGNDFRLSAAVNFNLGTLPNQGSDLSLDSDFSQDFIYEGITNEPQLNNIDLGLIPGLLVCNIDSLLSPVCNNSGGEFLIRISGGTQPYQALLTLDGNTIQTHVLSANQGAFAFNDLVAGTYEIIITDSNNATCETTYTLEDFEINCTISKTDIDCSGNNGSATVVTVGGSGNYGYNWNNGASQTSITNLPAGLYTVTVTDLTTQCSTICDTEIIESSEFELQISSVDDFCGDSTGSASLSLTGGSGAFEIIWANGETGESITSLFAGQYSVTVTDLVDGCQKVREVSIIDFPRLECQLSTSETECDSINGEEFITLNIQIEGGLAPYQVSSGASGITIEDILNFPSSPTVEVQNSGTYIIEVQDANGCMSVCEIDIEVEFLQPQVSGIMWLESIDGINGILDTLDLRFEGGTVNLYSANDLQQPILTEITDEFGQYAFFDVSEGLPYIVEFVFESEDLEFVEKWVQSNPQTNSDVNPDSGYTGAFEITGCYGKEFLNAGIREK